MKTILVILAVWLVWRWYLGTLARGRRARTAAKREPVEPDLSGLTRQDITDADYEELP